MARTGLLLINLGTPDSTRVRDVRRYLREFLSDPRVLDVNPLLRAFLLNVIILPTRPRKSAEAYREIWDPERGSPLVYHGLDLVRLVQERVGDEVRVDLAMRYQNPSIRDALQRFREEGIDEIVAFPLFPQYSSAATGSALEKLWTEASALWNTPNLQVVPEYYDHPAFIEAFAAVARPQLEELGPERVLMSFHGVPERHVVKSDESGGRHCLKSADCCARIVHANRRCYRAQCFETARRLAAALSLDEGRFEVAFQSRLGRDPWIRPYTDERITDMAAKEGVKKLAVLCPAFVADCLETIEEIGMRAKEDFEAAGGEELRLVSSLNAEPAWADALVEIARDTSVLGVSARFSTAGTSTTA